MLKEIAIALYDSPGGIEEGDVIVCRNPLNGIGEKEGEMWLWGIADINELLANIIDKPRRDLITNKIINKRRFKIPLEKIKQLDLNFSRSRARNLADKYQPYFTIDHNFLLVDPDPTTFELEKMSVIWDKVEGKFI